jgi:hypothetical protein
MNRSGTASSGGGLLWLFDKKQQILHAHHGFITAVSPQMRYKYLIFVAFLVPQGLRTSLSRVRFLMI